jgi:hypothetical protein
MAADMRIAPKMAIAVLGGVFPRSNSTHNSKDSESKRIAHRWLSVDVMCQCRAATKTTPSHPMKNVALDEKR